MSGHVPCSDCMGERKGEPSKRKTTSKETNRRQSQARGLTDRPNVCEPDTPPTSEWSRLGSLKVSNCVPVSGLSGLVMAGRTIPPIWSLLAPCALVRRTPSEKNRGRSSARIPRRCTDLSLRPVSLDLHLLVQRWPSAGTRTYAGRQETGRRQEDGRRKRKKEDDQRNKWRWKRMDSQKRARES